MMMNVKFPKPLESGQTIGIFSPSSSIVSEKFESGIRVLKERGFNLIIHPQTYEGMNSGNQYSGTAEQKNAAFMDLWTNPNIDAIIASCGGNGAVHMLPLIDWELIKKTPKILMGFSDTTALISAIYAKTGISGFFGPTVQTLGKINDVNLTFEILNDNRDDLIHLTPAKILKHGRVEAPVFVATLSVLIALAGTKFFPNLDGHILIIEDTGDELSRYDRMLWQLGQIIDYKSLAGIVLGDFLSVLDTGRPFGQTFETVIRNNINNNKINGPVIMNAPIGHGTRLFPIPLGRNIILDTASIPHLILN